MFSLAAHTTDDRGRRVTVFTARGQPAARFEADPGLRDIVERLARTAQPGLNQPIQPLHIVSMLPFAVIPMVLVLSGVLRGGMSVWDSSAIAIAMFLAAAPVLIWSGNRVMAGRTRCTLLLEGRCPSCAYTLSGLAHESDGCILCPECNAAWSRETIGTPRPARAESPTRAPAMRPYTTRAGAVDAFDRAVRLRDPFLRDLDPERAAELGPDRLNEIRSEVAARTLARKWTSLLACSLLWVFTAGTQLLLAATTPGPLRRAWPAAVATLFTFAIAMLVYRIFTYRSRSTALPAARVLIEHGLCPSCAGDLEPSPESLLTCRACRAAWKPTGP